MARIFSMAIDGCSRQENRIILLARDGYVHPHCFAKSPHSRVGLAELLGGIRGQSI